MLLQFKIEMMVVHATRIESRSAPGARILAVQILGNRKRVVTLAAEDRMDLALILTPDDRAVPG